MDLLDIFSQHRLRWFKGSKLSSSPFATLIISRSLRCRAARVVKSRQLPVWTRAEMTCQGTSYVQPRPHRKWRMGVLPRRGNEAAELRPEPRRAELPREHRVSVRPVRDLAAGRIVLTSLWSSSRQFAADRLEPGLLFIFYKIIIINPGAFIRFLEKIIWNI